MLAISKDGFVGVVKQRELYYINTKTYRYNSTKNYDSHDKKYTIDWCYDCEIIYLWFYKMCIEVYRTLKRPIVEFTINNDIMTKDPIMLRSISSIPEFHIIFKLIDDEVTSNVNITNPLLLANYSKSYYLLSLYNNVPTNFNTPGYILDKSYVHKTIKGNIALLTPVYDVNFIVVEHGPIKFLIHKFEWLNSTKNRLFIMPDTCDIYVSVYCEFINLLISQENFYTLCNSDYNYVNLIFTKNIDINGFRFCVCDTMFKKFTL